VMFSLVVGGAIAGLLGAIVALPVTAAGRDVYRYLFHRLSDEPANRAASAVREPDATRDERDRTRPPVATTVDTDPPPRQAEAPAP
jgi:hypothetical protein